MQLQIKEKKVNITLFLLLFYADRGCGGSGALGVREYILDVHRHTHSLGTIGKMGRKTHKHKKNRQ